MHTHSHTHSLIHTHLLTLTYSLTHSHTPTSLIHTQTYLLAHTHSLIHSHLHSQSLIHTQTHSCSYTHLLTHSLDLTHTLNSLLISCFLMVAASCTWMQKSQEEKTLALRSILWSRPRNGFCGSPFTILEGVEARGLLGMGTPTLQPWFWALGWEGPWQPRVQALAAPEVSRWRHRIQTSELLMNRARGLPANQDVPCQGRKG